MRKFTDGHEWIEVQGSVGVVGVTAFAKKELGDIVFIDLPEIGKVVKAGDEVVILESTKAAADIYAPVSGTITAVNTAIKDNPSLFNNSPEGEGWIYRMNIALPHELDSLKTHDEYAKMVTESE